MMNRKRLFIIIIAVLIVWIMGGIAACLYFRHNTIGAKIVQPQRNTTAIILNRHIDLGNVSDHELISAQFIVVNNGLDTLYIDGINPDCNCTQFILGKNPVPPKDSSVLSLYVNTQNKAGQNTIHTILSANTEERYYDLTIAFYVDLDQLDGDDLYIGSDPFCVGNVVSCKPINIRQFVYNKQSSPIDILQVRTSCSCLKVEDYPNRILSGECKEICLSLTPEIAGAFEKTVILTYLCNGEEKKKHFKVSGNSVSN